MGRFVSTSTGVQFSVDDSKDERYSGEGFEPAEADAKKSSTRATAKKTAAKSTSDDK